MTLRDLHLVCLGGNLNWLMLYLARGNAVFTLVFASAILISVLCIIKMGDHDGQRDSNESERDGA